jgi:hypothetical protein
MMTSPIYLAASAAWNQAKPELAGRPIADPGLRAVGFDLPAEYPPARYHAGCHGMATRVGFSFWKSQGSGDYRVPGMGASGPANLTSDAPHDDELVSLTEAASRTGLTAVTTLRREGRRWFVPVPKLPGRWLAGRLSTSAAAARFGTSRHLVQRLAQTVPGLAMQTPGPGSRGTKFFIEDADLIRLLARRSALLRIPPDIPVTRPSRAGMSAHVE